MKQESRTKNVTRNALVGGISQVITVIIEFAIRTVFIKALGAEYLGVNGLFTNILTVLSFAELGIGNAIIFSMYSATAKKDIEKIKSLMVLYKKAYICIGLIVFTIGICIMPFLDLIIEDMPNIAENIYVIYFLFLLNTVASYFLMYKKSIILANQKNYIISCNKLVIEIIKVVIQIIVLLELKNFIFFLLVQIICTILDNIIDSLCANKLFPCIKDKDITPLNKDEKNKIFVNVKSLILYKFGSIILNGTDNIIISKMLGLKIVGIVSNFNLLINTIVTIVGNVLNGFTTSIGNLNAEDNRDKQESILKQLFMICVWIYGFCSISFIGLSNDFINLWIGKEYILPTSTVVAIALHLYVNGVQFAGFTYRTTMGLFKEGKYSPVIAAVINIVLSVILCKYFGVTGIILATSISRLVTTTWYDIYIVYKHGFNKSPLEFYRKYSAYFVLTGIVGVGVCFLLNMVTIQGILGFVLKMLICVIIINTIFLLAFIKTDEFKKVLSKVKGIIWKKKNVI